MCFEWFSQQATTISRNNVKWLVCVMETDCVLTVRKVLNIRAIFRLISLWQWDMFRAKYFGFLLYHSTNAPYTLQFSNLSWTQDKQVKPGDLTAKLMLLRTSVSHRINSFIFTVQRLNILHVGLVLSAVQYRMFIRAGTSNYTQPCERVQEIDIMSMCFKPRVYLLFDIFRSWQGN